MVAESDGCWQNLGELMTHGIGFVVEIVQDQLDETPYASQE
jgi:hypothetical protein